MVGAGLYSWFNDYTQNCLTTENCQERGFEAQQSSDLWLYNLCTRAIVMSSPLGDVPTYARDNKNGFLSSVLGWLKGSTGVTGGREFPGYRVWYRAMLDHMPGVVLPEECKAALTEVITCDNRTERFQTPGLRSWLGNAKATDTVCAPSCGKSLKRWFDTVSVNCRGKLIDGALPTLLGGRIWDGWNQTCLKDPATGKYCGEIIDGFNKVSSIEQTPRKDLCSFCWIQHYTLAQQSQFSKYDEFIQSQPRYATGLPPGQPQHHHPGLAHRPARHLGRILPERQLVPPAAGRHLRLDCAGPRRRLGGTVPRKPDRHLQLLLAELLPVRRRALPALALEPDLNPPIRRQLHIHRVQHLHRHQTRPPWAT